MQKLKSLFKRKRAFKINAERLLFGTVILISLVLFVAAFLTENEDYLMGAISIWFILIGIKIVFEIVKAIKKELKRTKFPLKNVIKQSLVFLVGTYVLSEFHISVLFIWTLGWLLWINSRVRDDDRLDEDKAKKLFLGGLTVWTIVLIGVIYDSWQSDWWGNIGEFFWGGLFIILGIVLGALGGFILYKLGKLFIKIYKKVDRWADKD